MPASYFDVDGTLVTTNLMHPTVFYMVNQASPLRSLGKLARAAMDAPGMVLAEWRDRRTFNEMLYGLYQGISEDRLLALADEAFDTVLKNSLYPGARDLVANCRERGHDLNECFAYSDSYSDVPLLSVVGQPAAVNPDAALERLARAYHWPILNLDRAP